MFEAFENLTSVFRLIFLFYIWNVFVTHLFFSIQASFTSEEAFLLRSRFFLVFRADPSNSLGSVASP